jgi:hypothetical protein
MAIPPTQWRQVTRAITRASSLKSAGTRHARKRLRNAAAGLRLSSDLTVRILPSDATDQEEASPTTLTISVERAIPAGGSCPAGSAQPA